MTAVLQKFLDKVAEIAAEKPTYRQPGIGDDGTCDCIGLIIGALKRMGIKWNGLHGTNYAIRKAVIDIRTVSNPSHFNLGDVVFKAYEKGDAKWTLNKYPRYLPGGAYYNGDLLDYYHVGVVTSVNPLRITHMTSPTIMVDKSVGRWRFAARLKLLVSAGAYNGASVPASGTASGSTTKPETKKEVPANKTATVTANSGRAVKMRQKPTTSCRAYDEVPVGATVTLVEYGTDWSKISYGKRSGWYMMTKFLKIG